ncbi:hypothetical protein [Sanyastnella coralliicola]|uniref:hypothetical protein n=1 Tax=Sanyastnella coralliicola TaxID=3069118 RepID=UPI0027B9F1FE|nr:hypothetical protein [Longitalea sp. SCSIO 12813]
MRRLLKNVLAVLLFFAMVDLSAQTCYMASGNSEDIYEVEIATGIVLNTYSMSMNFGNIAGFYGIARNPVDGQIYALVDEGSGVRSFGLVDIDAQTVTEIGSISYIMETMQFTSDGTLYAMTASNDDTPSRFCTINVSTGALTILADFDLWGGFAQALVYDQSSDQMYRIEGGGGSPFGSDFYWWQQVDYGAASIPNQTMMNPGLLDSFPWTIAMCYEQPGSYLVTDLDMLYSVDASGNLSNPRTMGIANPEIAGIVLTETTGVVNGCTDPLACNYNENATNDNGSCCFDNCVELTVGGGSFDSEIEWTILDNNGAVFASGGAGITSYCMPADCYTFEMVDTFGDGWNGATYTFTENGVVVATGDLDTAETGDGESFGSDAFEIGGGCNQTGCLDPTACNYNENATTDDGNCIYAPENDACAVCSGETDGTGTVIQSPDTDNDGLCDAEEINIWGTDPLIQDTDGDGLTDGAEVFVTSTDPMNTDTNANGCDDLNENIGNCGDINECQSDLNGDGLVNASDLLIFLSGFGSTCD